MRERRDERSAKVTGWAQRSPLRVNATFGLVKPDTARLPYSNQCGQILETLKGNTAELRKLQILTLASASAFRWETALSIHRTKRCSKCSHRILVSSHQTTAGPSQPATRCSGSWPSTPTDQNIRSAPSACRTGAGSSSQPTTWRYIYGTRRAETFSDMFPQMSIHAVRAYWANEL